VAEPITSSVFTAHSRAEMRGRDVLQARTEVGGRAYLLRVIVDVNHEPAEVVTAYRTSRIDKYWRKEE
jgi:hypothetical protein